LIVVAGVVACGDDNSTTPDNGGNGNTADTTPPSAVTDLRTESPTINSIALVWTAPGDDGDSGTAAGYDIRYSTEFITDLNWETAVQVDDEPAPKACGEIETLRITNLDAGTTYYFALTVSDEVPNPSGLSNCVCDSTGQETTAPADITDLYAQHASATSFLLTWTAPGDDGANGTASTYDVRYSTEPITEQNWESTTRVADVHPPPPAGTPDSLLVSGLTAQTNYLFAVRTADEVPNWSGISNEAPGLAEGNNLWVYPLRVQQGRNITIVYRRASSGTTALHAHYHDEAEQWVRLEVDFPWPPGIYVREWDFRDIHDEYHYRPTSYYWIKLLWNMVVQEEVQVWLDR
jgi:hypothetical protein